MEIGIYGLGRFGAFWAQFLAEKGKVRAYSRSADRPTPPGVRRVGLAELMEADTVFLCNAISSMPEVLREIAPLVRPGALIADTCSVKVQPARWMAEILPSSVRLLATHPMFGPDSARLGAQGLPIVIHDLRDAARETATWEGIFQSLGLRVLKMTPEEHDRAAAYTQGVTHLVGRLLAEMGLQPHPIATKGYKALLEIMEQTCNDPWQLFLDLQRFNPFTAEMRAEVFRAFQKIQKDLEQTPQG